MRFCLIWGGLLFTASFSLAQRDSIPQRPGIYFPQAPKAGQYRRSIGATFTATPPELTEELHASIPAIDVNLQRGLGRGFYLIGRLQTQFVQSSGTMGIRYALPLSKRLFVSVGDDMNGWFGALKIKNVFSHYNRLRHGTLAAGPGQPTSIRRGVRQLGHVPDSHRCECRPRYLVIPTQSRPAPGCVDGRPKRAYSGAGTRMSHSYRIWFHARNASGVNVVCFLK